MRTRFVILATLGATLTIGLAACGGGGSTDHKSTPAAPGKAASASVMVSQSSLGQILTDQDRRTLYAFTNDKNGTSSCNQHCIATWPGLLSRTAATAGPGTDKALLGQTKRADGTVQTTYNGWPLYYFAGDMNPGDVDGQGVDGVWWVLGADGKLIKK